MATTMESSLNPAAREVFEQTWMRRNRDTGPNSDKEFGAYLFASGFIEGANQALAVYRGESNQEPPNDETS